MSEWKKFSEELPKIGDCFVTPYTDGSGCCIYIRIEDEQGTAAPSSPLVDTYLDGELDYEWGHESHEDWCLLPKHLWWSVKREKNGRLEKIDLEETKNHIKELEQEIERLKALVGE